MLGIKTHSLVEPSFAIHLNDLGGNLKFITKLYTDGTCLISPVKTLKTATSDANNDI